jgi:hypothetical protein
MKFHTRFQYLTSPFPDTRHLKPSFSNYLLSDKGFSGPNRQFYRETGTLSFLALTYKAPL